MTLAPSPRIDRVTSASARDGLERLAGSEVLKSGAVNLIGLDAIRDHLGPRWGGKRDRIWEHVERDLEKRLGAFDMALRLDEATYLVAMPSATRFAAQVTCLHAMQDILKFFLGESRPSDIRVSNVTQVSSDSVSSAPLDAMALAAESRKPPPVYLPDSEPEQPAKAWRPPLAGRTESGLFVSRARLPVEVRLGVQAVRNLKRNLVTSYLIERSTQPAVDDNADLLQVDIAVMAYASSLMQEHQKTGGRLTLHVPISYASAASIRGRELALQIMRNHRERAREIILIEIADLDPGVPPSRLLETVSLLKPFCMGVLARVRPSLGALSAVKDCGLRGLILEAHGLGHTPAEIGPRLKAFADAARGVTPNLIVHGLNGPDLVKTAAACGFTHASLWPELKFEAGEAAA
jgi:hypothetical protein